jgi:biotin operon repressor
VYLEIGRNAAHLRELGISDRAIARALGVSDKTVAKSLRALGALGRSVGAREGEPTQR